jgi:hypothetical protein
VDQIIAITDEVTEANDAYMKERVGSGLQALALATFPSKIKYLMEDEVGDPTFTNLQDLLDSVVGGGGEIAAGIELIAKILYNAAQADATISTNRTKTLVKSPSKKFFKVYTSVNINTMHFENVTVILGNTTTVTNCSFRNCIINVVSNGDVIFDSSILENCNIENTNEIGLQNGTEVSFSKIKSNINFLDSTCKMYGCMYKTTPTNETDNLTLSFNTHLSGL